MSKNLIDDLMITTSYDDPDPEGTDVDGILPLLAPYSEEDEEGEEDEESEETKGGEETNEETESSEDDNVVAPDSSQGVEIMGASQNASEEAELEAEIEPGFREIAIPGNQELPDDDPDGLSALSDSLSPGEAEEYLDYMRPLSEEEAELVNDPMFKDLRWVDDPAHTDDLLRTTKGDHAMDQRLRDTTYGEPIMRTGEELLDLNNSDMRETTDKLLDLASSAARETDEELADRLDSDKLASWSGGDTSSPATYVHSRDAGKLALVRGLSQALQCGHARYLRAADRSAGVAVRPASYYMNVAGLWTQRKLRRNLVPTSPRANWRRFGLPTLLGAAQTLLDETTGVRLFDAQTHSSMMGWGLSSLNPVKAIKKAAKGAYKYGVKMPTKYAYKYGVKMPTKYAYKYGVKMPTKYGVKYGVKMPAKYAYKGAKTVGKLAQNVALRPIKAIIRKFTRTLVKRRATTIAKQKGLAKPGRAEQIAALSWAKNFVRTKNPKYGSAIASLMGAEYGIHDVDISLGHDEHDLMGISKTGAAGLILLGPVGLIAVLTGLVKLSKSAAPPQPGEDPYAEQFAQPEEGYAEEEPQDYGAEEYGTEEDYGEQDYGTEDYGDYAEGDNDTSGAKGRGGRGIGKRIRAYFFRTYPNGIPKATFMKLRLAPLSVAKALVKAGKLKIV